jgi:hypothetical protein
MEQTLTAGEDGKWRVNSPFLTGQLLLNSMENHYTIKREKTEYREPIYSKKNQQLYCQICD